MLLTIDIETNMFQTKHMLTKEINTIHCIGIKEDKNPTKCFTNKPIEGSDGSLEDAIKLLQKATIIIGHNIVKFDIPVIHSLLCNTNAQLVDTLLLSKMVTPDKMLFIKDAITKGFPSKLYGSHSLKAWGYRLGDNKIEYNDFENLCPEMITYCKQDVELTYKLYHFIKKMPSYPPENAIKCETEFARIMHLQENSGFYFDYDKAMQYADTLYKQQDLYKRLLDRKFPLIILPIGKTKIAVDNPTEAKADQKYKDFTPVKATKNKPIGTQWTDIKVEKPNFNSRQQLINLLQKKGVIFNKVTEKGNIIFE